MRQANPRARRVSSVLSLRTTSSFHGISCGRSALRRFVVPVSGGEMRKVTSAQDASSTDCSSLHASRRRPRSTRSVFDCHFTSASSERRASRKASSTETMRSGRSRTLRFRRRMISSSRDHRAQNFPFSSTNTGFGTLMEISLRSIVLYKILSDRTSQYQSLQNPSQESRLFASPSEHD